MTRFSTRESLRPSNDDSSDQSGTQLAAGAAYPGHRTGPIPRSRSHNDPRLDPAIRAVAAVGSWVIGAVHLLEFDDQLRGALWLAIGFMLLTVSGPLAALQLPRAVTNPGLQGR